MAEFFQNMTTRTIKQLGKGSEGTADLVVPSENADPIVKKTAIVRRRHQKPKARTLLHETVALFGALRGDSHFTVRGVCFDFGGENKYSRIYMEYCNGGDLDDIAKRMRDKNIAFPESFLWHVLVHLCAGALFLHTGAKYCPRTQTHISSPRDDHPGLVHRDIHDANVFIRHSPVADGTSKYPDLVLGDLGHSEFIKPSQGLPVQEEFGYWQVDHPPASNQCGASQFLPPERGSQGRNPVAPDSRYDYYQIAHIVIFIATAQWSQHVKKDWPHRMERIGYSSALIETLKTLHCRLDDRLGDREIIALLYPWQKTRDAAIQQEESDGAGIPVSVWGPNYVVDRSSIPTQQPSPGQQQLSPSESPIRVEFVSDPMDIDEPSPVANRAFVPEVRRPSIVGTSLHVQGTMIPPQQPLGGPANRGRNVSNQ